ncbi:MAG: type II toxin-antitoxin system HicB family antitoxin [Lachnospiraceae bacterium]|nr:type II toxin-antitoxin system HicB family antitoxin [Lachnospiraceae bacterium]
MLTVYPACFFQEHNGGYSVIFPDLNYLSTCGDSLDDAMEMAIDCLAGYIYTCQNDGDILPKPSKLNDIDPQKIASDIDPESSVGEAFVNLISIDVKAYAKEHFEKSVRKTLTIPAWLNNAALEKNINFSQTLQEALLTKIKA